jgi:hypothetical protein
MDTGLFKKLAEQKKKDDEMKKIVSEPEHSGWQTPDEGTRRKVIAHSRRLHKNHPAWSAEKVARKTAEHFKLKMNTDPIEADDNKF